MPSFALAKIEFSRMALPVLASVGLEPTVTPLPVLNAITLPAPAVVPPIVSPDAPPSMKTPY